MKILMYGWEFPPLISGGLGVACHAIVQELAKKNVDITVVLPYAVESPVDQKRVSIIGCDAVVDEVKGREGINKQGGIFDLMDEKFSAILSPYAQFNNAESLAHLDKASEKIAKIIAHLQELHKFASLDELSLLRSQGKKGLGGEYGMNLMAEVCYYAIVAGALAATVPHDVIHTHDWLTVLAGIEAKRRSGKPLVVHIHALEPDRSGIMVDTRILAIEKYGMEQADKVVAVSEYTKKIIIEKYGIASDKIVVVHNGTYTSDMVPTQKPAKRYKMVLFLGRLAHQKGPFHFIEAAKKILEKRQDVHFVIAGVGGLLKEMIHRVAALHLGKYIHFVGFLGHENIARIFNLADVYVMPSISEPFGLSCLEALSYGVPVLISKQSGVAEVLPHVMKVDFWDINEMANKILALIDHQALRQITLRQSREDLKELSWEETAASLVNLYAELVQ